MGEALWEVREWRQQGLATCQSWSKKKDIRCHLEGDLSQGSSFKWDWLEHVPVRKEPGQFSVQQTSVVSDGAVV